MAFTAADGPLGLEATHAFVGSTGSFTLNDIASYPHYKLDKITGLHALGDTQDDQREILTRRAFGERVSQVGRQGKTITYKGRVRARTLQSLRTAVNALEGACAATPEGTVTIAPDAAIGGVSHFYTGRVIACDVDDEQTLSPTTVPSAYQREFILSIRLGDPRVYVVGAHVTSGIAAGATQVVNNAGKKPSDLFFVDIVGAISANVLLENLTTGLSLKVLNPAVAAGKTFRVNWQLRQVLNLTDLVDLSHRIDPTNYSWWDDLGTHGLAVQNVPGLAPGNNSIKVSGYGSQTWAIGWNDAN